MTYKSKSFPVAFECLTWETTRREKLKMSRQFSVREVITITLQWDITMHVVNALQTNYTREVKSQRCHEPELLLHLYLTRSLSQTCGMNHLEDRPMQITTCRTVKRWRAVTWISGTTVRLSEQEPANAVSGAGDTTGLGLVKLLRSQLGISFSSCRMTMVSMTKKRPHGNQRVCSWVMNGARSKCRATAMPPLVTKSKLEQRRAQCEDGCWYTYSEDKLYIFQINTVKIPISNACNLLCLED